MNNPFERGGRHALAAELIAGTILAGVAGGMVLELTGGARKNSIDRKGEPK